MIRKLKPSNEPICGVFAATLATPDIPLCFVKGMAHESMQSRSRWTGRMYFYALKNLLTMLGVTYEDKGISGGSLRSVAESLCPTKHYIVFVTGHFLTMYGNHCYDQCNVDGTPISEFWCKGSEVKAVIEIDRSKPALTFSELFPEE